MSSYGVYYFGEPIDGLSNGELVARVENGVRYDCMVPVGIRIREHSSFEYESKFDRAVRAINSRNVIVTGEPELVGK